MYDCTRQSASTSLRRAQLLTPMRPRGLKVRLGYRLRPGQQLIDLRILCEKQLPIERTPLAGDSSQPATRYRAGHPQDLRDPSTVSESPSSTSQMMAAM